MPSLYAWTLHGVSPLLDLTLGLVLGNAIPLLYAANQLVLLPVDGRQVIVGQFAPLLLHLAGKLLPVPFDSIPVHDSLLWKVTPLMCSTALSLGGCRPRLIAKEAESAS